MCLLYPEDPTMKKERILRCQSAELSVPSSSWRRSRDKSRGHAMPSRGTGAGSTHAGAENDIALSRGERRQRSTPPPFFPLRGLTGMHTNTLDVLAAPPMAPQEAVPAASVVCSSAALGWHGIIVWRRQSAPTM